MWRVPLPTYSAMDAYAACISSIRPGDLKNRLTDASGCIEAADVTYREAGENGILGILSRHSLTYQMLRLKKCPDYMIRRCQQVVPLDELSMTPCDWQVRTEGARCAAPEKL